MPTTARTYQSAGLFTCYEPLNDTPLLAGRFIKSGLSNSSQMIFEGSIDSVGSVGLVRPIRQFGRKRFGT